MSYPRASQYSKIQRQNTNLWCDTHCFTLWCSKFISPLEFTEITTSSPTRKSSRKGSYVSTTLLFWNFICTLSSSWVSFWRLEQKKTLSEQCSLLYYNYYHDHYLFVWHGPYANMVIATVISINWISLTKEICVCFAYSSETWLHY